MYAEQAIKIFSFIFLILVIPAIIWYIYTLFRDRKYTDIVDVTEVRTESRFNVLRGGMYYVPIYKYRYNYREYETESRFIKFPNRGEIDDRVQIKLKVNPDDPYDVKEANRLQIRQKITFTKTDLMILIICIITALITFLVVLMIA